MKLKKTTKYVIVKLISETVSVNNEGLTQRIQDIEIYSQHNSLINANKRLKKDDNIILYKNIFKILGVVELSNYHII